MLSATALRRAWIGGSTRSGLVVPDVVCLDALRMSDVSLDRSGKLDDPDYISGLSKGERARLSRRNVFAFSLSVASHEVLQLVGLITGHQRIGGRALRAIAPIQGSWNC